MLVHPFTLVLDREPTEDEIDTLFEVGLDDAIPEYGDGVTFLRVRRAAARLAGALVSAIRHAEQAGFTVTAVRMEDRVSLSEIAVRTGRSYESVVLLATGQLGPGGFPPAFGSGSWALYSWAQVGQWFTHYDPEGVLPYAEDAREIAAADHLVQARFLLSGNAHRTVFERLFTA